MANTVMQFSIFLENKVGRLAEVCKLLGMNSINILGFSISDAGEYGVLRLIVDKPDAAMMKLHEGEFTVRCREVVCVDVPHAPGGLGSVLQLLADEKINVEYLYATAKTLIAFGVDNTDRALKVLEENNISAKSLEDIVS